MTAARTPRDRARQGARDGAFVRARGLLEQACDFDPSVAAAVREPHLAIDPYGRILGVSAGVAAWLGFPASTLIGRRIVHRVIASGRGGFQRALLEARGGRAFPSIEVAIRTKANDVLQVALAAAATGRCGGEEVIVLSVRRVDDGARFVPLEDGASDDDDDDVDGRRDDRA